MSSTNNLTTSSSSTPPPTTDPLFTLPTPPKLDPSTRLLLALACRLSTSTRSANESIPNHRQWWISIGDKWLESICKMIEFDIQSLPDVVELEGVSSSARGYWDEMEEQDKIEEWGKISIILVLGSIFTPPVDDKLVTNINLPNNPHSTPSLSYSPPTRALTISTLQILSIPLHYLLTSESQLSTSLYNTLQLLSSTAEVESTRQASSSGWGGSFGRNLATGFGIALGGITIGLTGGLAAPAIAALIPSFLTFGLLTTATAPLVLGSVFGIAGGGLTGRRVRERWSGVGEFEFVDVKMGSRRIEELPYEVRKKGREVENEKVGDDEEEEEGKEEEEEEEKKSTKMDDDNVAIIEEKTKVISIQVPTPPTEEAIKAASDRPPSLVAIIAVPGLLTLSPTEAISTWQTRVVPHSFSDGRDVYVLRFETQYMLSTGRAINQWVTNKFKGYVKKEVIKRTMLYAYFAAVSLPLSVYSMATMGLDNTWMQSQDKARKAGQLLGEVLEKRVQGQRPVVLIGSSLGSLTILHALLHLSSLPYPHSLPHIVDSAYLISLPSAPTPEEWSKVRSVVAGRVVNGWCGNDLVLAGVVRLHEVLSRATTLNSGIRVAGLGPISQPGIEDIDLNDVVDGHLDLQLKMPDILDVLRVDG